MKAFLSELGEKLRPLLASDVAALKALLAPDHATPAASPDKHRDDEGGDSEATPRYDDGESDRRPAEPSWRGPGLLLHSPPKPRGSAVLAPIVP